MTDDKDARIAALEAELAAERERNSNNIAGAALELAAERDKVFVLTRALRAECNLHGDSCRCEHCKLVFAATPPSTPPARTDDQRGGR